MEKKVYFNKEALKHQQHRSSHKFPQLPRKEHFRGLGGISLYNEQYQRHLEKINKNSNMILQQSQIQQQTERNKSHKTVQEIFDEEYFEQCEIQDFMRSRDKADKHTEQYSIAHEIQDIISSFKVSQHHTVNLLQQIEKRHDLEEYKTLQQFDHLVEFYNSHNKKSFTLLFVRIFEQLKHKMNQELQRIKEQYEHKIKLKAPAMTDKQTQINLRNVDSEISTLKKQLRAKEIQYNVLYDFKRQMLQRKDNYLTTMALQQKIKEISKLEEENKSKSIQVKRLQKQVENYQDKFFNKLIQNQRKESGLLFRSELESILEDQYPEKFRRGSNKHKGRNLINKTHKKGKVSRLSLGNDLIANKMMDFIVSAFEINDKPRSLKQMPNFTMNDFDSQLSFDQRRSTKKFIQKKTLKQIIDKYQQIDKRKKSSLRKNAQGKIQRNQSVKLIGSEVSMKQKKSSVSIEKQPINKVAQMRKVSGVTGTQQTIFAEAKSAKSLKTNQRISDNSKIQQIKRTKQIKPSDEDQSILGKFSSSKMIKADYPSKKIKKGVSFQLDQFMHKGSLRFNSNLVSFCFNPVGATDLEKMTATPDTVDNEDFISTGEATEKIKNEKSKLTKVKPKQKKHFKVASFQNDSLKVREQKFNRLKQRQTSTDKIRVRSIAKIGSLERKSFKANLAESFLERDKPVQRNGFSFSLQEQDEYMIASSVKKMMVSCKSKDRFYGKLCQVHKDCGQNCQHIKKYLEMFDKLKQEAQRPTVKLNCQNLNKHIRKSNSIYSRSSKVNIASIHAAKEEREF